MKLTKSDIDVIICLMDDMNDIAGLNPEELELKEKIEEYLINDNK